MFLQIQGHNNFPYWITPNPLPLHGVVRPGSCHQSTCECNRLRGWLIGITVKQEATILQVLQGMRYPAQDRVLFLLSIKAGLRVKEIALLTWGMGTDADGQDAFLGEDTPCI